MSSPTNSRLLARLLLAGLLVLALPGSAIDRLSLQIGKLAGPGWQLDRLDMQWDLNGDQLQLSIARLELPQQPLRDLQLDCSGFSLTGQWLDCPNGRASFTSERLSARDTPISLRYWRDSGRLQLRLPRLALAGGRVGLDFDGRGGEWRATLQLRGLETRRLLRVLAPAQKTLPPVEGGLAGRIAVRAGTDGSLRLEPRLRLTGFGVQRLVDGREFIVDSSDISITGKIDNKSDKWVGNLELKSNAGELLLPGFYADLSAAPLSASLRGRLTTGDALDWRIERLRLGFGKQLALRLSGRGGAQLQQLQLQLAPTDIARLYRDHLQPVLLHPLAANLELAGRVGLSATLDGGGLTGADIALTGLAVEDADPAEHRRRFGLYGVDGDLHYRRSGGSPPSHLNWQGGHFYERIDIGPAVLSLDWSGRQVALAGPGRIPVLDGELQIQRLRVAREEDGPAVDFDGVLTPVSLQRLSRALDWPPISGRLSGVIPGVRYRKGDARIDGVLLLKAFDGELLVRDMRAGGLLGDWPTLGADIELRRLDLEQLTRTFSFGRITGRIDGRIDQLRLENWQPVSFDARFASSKEPGRRRISQRAVDNISNLGGVGVAGALSRTFLRFFKDFGYSRIGIACRLHDGVCEMDGVEPAEQGYYLVKGGGLPRIDVIGYNRQTDWQILVERLASIAASEGPVIE